MVAVIVTSRNGQKSYVYCGSFLRAFEEWSHAFYSPWRDGSIEMRLDVAGWYVAEHKESGF